MESLENTYKAMSEEVFPLPDVVCAGEKSLEREEVMAEMQPLLSRLRGKWTEELAADIAATLTPEKLQVLEPHAKGLFAGWIYQQDDQKYMEWLKAAEADLTSVTWDEKTIIPVQTMCSDMLLRMCVEWHQQEHKKIPIMDDEAYYVFTHSESVELREPADWQA
ncbi:hypothetical protein V8C35DRAFT_280502 [Trichoderma chlorosporum]